jgi:hypothetical protein
MRRTQVAFTITVVISLVVGFAAFLTPRAAYAAACWHPVTVQYCDEHFCGPGCKKCTMKPGWFCPQHSPEHQLCNAGSTCYTWDKPQYSVRQWGCYEDPCCTELCLRRRGRH